MINVLNIVKHKNEKIKAVQLHKNTMLRFNLELLLNIEVESSMYIVKIYKWHNTYIIYLQTAKIHFEYYLNGLFMNILIVYTISIRVLIIIWGAGYPYKLTSTTLVKNILIISFLIKREPINTFLNYCEMPLRLK